MCKTYSQLNKNGKTDMGNKTCSDRDYLQRCYPTSTNVESSSMDRSHEI